MLTREPSLGLKLISTFYLYPPLFAGSVATRTPAWGPWAWPDWIRTAGTATAGRAASAVSVPASPARGIPPPTAPKTRTRGRRRRPRSRRRLPGGGSTWKRARAFYITRRTTSTRSEEVSDIPFISYASIRLSSSLLSHWVPREFMRGFLSGHVRWYCGITMASGINYYTVSHRWLSWLKRKVHCRHRWLSWSKRKVHC